MYQMYSSKDGKTSKGLVLTTLKKVAKISNALLKQGFIPFYSEVKAQPHYTPIRGSK